MICEVKMYSAKCDNCGETWEHRYHGWTAVPDEQGLQEELNEHSWHTDGEKHYCPDCFTADDNDVIHIKTEIKKL